MENLMIKEFIKTIGGYDIDMVVLFNKNHIKEDDVDKYIKEGIIENCLDVVTMFKCQYENLCDR